MKRLEDDTNDDSYQITNQLMHHSSLPYDVTLKLKLLVQSKVERIREVAVDILFNQQQLPPPIVSSLIDFLVTADNNRVYPLDTMGNKTILIQEHIAKFDAMLAAENTKSRTIALGILAGVQNLPHELIMEITRLVYDSDKEIQLISIKILSQQSEMTAEHFKSLNFFLVACEPAKIMQVVSLVNTSQPLLHRLMLYLNSIVNTKETLTSEYLSTKNSTCALPIEQTPNSLLFIQGTTKEARSPAVETKETNTFHTNALGH